MYYSNITITYACNNCKSYTPNGLITYRSKQSFLPKNRSELIAIINPTTLVCPSCGNSGECVVFAADYNDYKYDLTELEYKNNGNIFLSLIKSNNITHDIEFGSDNSNFNLIDFFNLINYSLQYLERIKENKQFLCSFDKMKNAEFYCKAVYFFPNLKFDEGAYDFGEIKAGNCTSYGFEYEEIKSELYDKRSLLLDKINIHFRSIKISKQDVLNINGKKSSWNPF